MTDEEKQRIYEKVKSEYPDGDEEFYQRHIEAIEYFRKHCNEKKEPREITSSTYERAQKRLHKKVSDWFGNR